MNWCGHSSLRTLRKRSASSTRWASWQKRPVTIRPIPGGARAEMVIAGHPSIFEKLFIHSTEGFVLPKVDYLEFFGKDLETGTPRYEKFLPD